MPQATYKWKGAVQPAEASSTNLELKLWKGAIQPAAAVASGAAGPRKNRRMTVINFLTPSSR